MLLAGIREDIRGSATATSRWASSEEALIGQHSVAAISSSQTAANEPARLQQWQGSSAFTQAAVLTRRAVLDFLKEPVPIVLAFSRPLILLYLVVYTFGRGAGRIQGFPAGITYFQFMLPAVMVDSAIQQGLQAGAGLIDEINGGFVARLRSLPILPGSILFAHSISCVVRTAAQVSFLLLLAQLTQGHLSPGGLVGIMALAGLTLLLGWSMAWVFLAASIRIRRASTMTNIGFTVMIPLMFLSSAYIPVADLPTALAVVARANPVTYAINAERAIFLPGVARSVGSGGVLPSILVITVLGAVAAYVAVRLFRRPLSDR
jgi:ABC-2 type transport system permease protein